MASSHIGSKVRIKVIEGDEFSGFVHSIDANTGKLTLDKVTLCGRGMNRRIQGLQHFYGKEIENIIKCEEVCSKLRKNASTGTLIIHKDSGPCLKKSKEKPKHLQNLQKLNNEELLLGSKRASSGDESNAKSRICSNGKSSDDTEQSDTNSYDPNSRYHLINKLDDRFFNAMVYLHQQSIIGIAFEGIEIGREGKLAWISIATKDDLILLDFLSLGEKCFTEGLKDILESQKILKVIHDCRLLSDILHHQYLIKLVNIFDTQVADVMIYHIRHKDWPRYVSGLSSCLFSHLELSPEQVHIMRVRESAKKEDQEIWCERPAPKFVMEAAIKHVEHLLDLRLILMEKMMTEFTIGVDIYLAQVKDVSDIEAQRALTSSHLLPFAFQHLHQFFHASHFNYTMPLRMRGSDTEKDAHGFNENCDGVIDPHVIASVDSIWHCGVNLKCPGVRKRTQSLNRNRSKERQQQRSSTAVSTSDHEPELRLARFPETCPVDESHAVSSSHDNTINHESSRSLVTGNKPHTHGGLSHNSESGKSSQKTTEFVLKESKSLSSLKLENPEKPELSGSELLKTLMATASNTVGVKEEKFAMRPAGYLQWNVRMNRRSYDPGSICKKSQSQSTSSENESSSCDADDYFGAIPSREVLKRSETFLERKLSESVPMRPQAIINGGSGKMVIALSSSDSDSYDVATPRRFECLDKQSRTLGPISATLFSSTPSDESQFVSASNKTKEMSSFLSVQSKPTEHQASPSSSHLVLQNEEYNPIQSESTASNVMVSSISACTNSNNNAFVENLHSHGVSYVKFDAEDLNNKSFQPFQTLASLSAGIGRGSPSPNSSYYNNVSSTSPQQKTPSPIGRGRSPTIYFPHTSSALVCPNIGNDRSVTMSPRTTLGNDPSVTISPHGRGTTLDNDANVTISPHGRGTTLGNDPSVTISPHGRGTTLGNDANVTISPHGRGTTLGNDANVTISPHGRGTTLGNDANVTISSHDRGTTLGNDPSVTVSQNGRTLYGIFEDRINYSQSPTESRIGQISSKSLGRGIKLC